jgi:glyoxylase-like metal-dependent hydrolase (beta-lactamase superfamily II)
MQIHSFTFSPFQENTYVVSDESKECIIIDPGCFFPEEEQELSAYIESNGLKPVRLINTHAHIDHIFGNAYVCKTYDLLPEMHRDELPLLEGAEMSAARFGLNITPSPSPEKFITEGDTIRFGNTSFDTLLLPGHAPGHLGLIHHEDKVAITGDVLFRLSIGRTDLPFCNHDDLIRSIREKLFLLDDDFVIYNGHGPTTTIGFEKENNPFVKISQS